MTQPCALYRHFDAAGSLLYVGISLNAVARAAQHRKAPWFADAVRMTTEHYPSREAAAEAERVAIRDEAPLHNVAHTVYQRAMGVMPPAHERGISIAHHVWIQRWFDERTLPDGAHFAHDLTSRIMGVAESTILRMVATPPGMNPCFSPAEIMELAGRLLRGRFDAEPLMTVETYRPQFVPFVRECAAEAPR